MKKILSVIIAAAILLSCTIIASAQIITDEDMGLSIYLDDNWVERPIDNGIYFEYSNSKEEHIFIRTEDGFVGMTLDDIDENDLRSYCANTLSNDALSNIFNTSNVSVTSESELSKYEYYNNVKYYRYEKSFTARAVGFYDKPYYDTIFITVQNGKAYTFDYFRNYERTQHFADITDMLNSASYDIGRVNISEPDYTTPDREISVILTGGYGGGTRVQFDQSPVIIQDRTFVPMRAIFEALGMSVEWDDSTKTVIAQGGSTILGLTVGDYNLYRLTNNNRDAVFTLDVPAVIINGRTLVPLRALGEALDADVGWDSNTNTVTIANAQI